MGYKKKNYRKKKTYRKKRGSKMTRWGNSKTNIHQYRRYGRGYSVPLTSNATGFDATAFAFAISRMTAYTDLAILYDQYKIDMVELRISWSPKLTLNANVNAPGQSTYPLLYYFKDYDDSTSPSSLNNMKERGNLRQVRINPNKIIKIYIKPSVLTEIASGGITALKPEWSNIIDMGNVDVPHYGLKIGIDHLPNFAQGSLDVEEVYHITCYGAK